MAKEELNAQIKELLAKLGAVTEKTSYEEMKALRQSVDAVAKAYGGAVNGGTGRESPIIRRFKRLPLLSRKS